MGQRPRLHLMSPHTRFPNLITDGYSIASPQTETYNCIAWAAGQTDRWWWPGPPGPPHSYWPPDIPWDASADCFALAFGTLGYEPCQDDSYEAGYEKVALYADTGGGVTHMARQIPTGLWTSKLGRSFDIEHRSLHGLEGSEYGHVAMILRRPGHNREDQTD